MGDAGDVVTLLQQASTELRDLVHGASVTRVHLRSLTALSFFRDFVAQNKPVVIEGAIGHWPALERWKSDDYLATQLGDRRLTVAVTPNGGADAVCAADEPWNGAYEDLFCLPHQTRATFRDFLAVFHGSKGRELGEADADILSAGPEGGVRWPRGPLAPYLQQQNSNLTDADEVAALLEDVSPRPASTEAADGLEWFSKSFGRSLDAVNFWYGDSRSSTSFHKDHYENVYAVITGEKHFTLLPPGDAYRMATRRYPKGSFKVDASTQRLVATVDEPRELIPWSPIFPGRDGPRERAAAPLFYSSDAPAPLTVTVRAGELLFLPAMWFHHVEQGEDDQGRTIAVNAWYDMAFDLRWVHAGLVNRLAAGLGLVELSSAEPDDEGGSSEE